MINITIKQQLEYLIDSINEYDDLQILFDNLKVLRHFITKNYLNLTQIQKEDIKQHLKQYLTDKNVSVRIIVKQIYNTI